MGLSENIQGTKGGHSEYGGPIASPVPNVVRAGALASGSESSRVLESVVTWSVGGKIGIQARIAECKSFLRPGKEFCPITPRGLVPCSSASSTGVKPRAGSTARATWVQIPVPPSTSCVPYRSV